MNTKQGTIVVIIIVSIVMIGGSIFFTQQANDYENRRMEEKRFLESEGFNVVEGYIRVNPSVVIPVNNVFELTQQAKSVNASTVYDRSIFDRHYWYIFNNDYSMAWRIDIGYGVGVIVE